MDTNEPLPPSWPAILQAALAEKAISQKQLAKILNRDPSMVSLYVSGKAIPKVSDRALIKGLAAFIGATTAQLDRLIGNYRPDERLSRRIVSANDLDQAERNDVSGVLRQLRRRRAWKTLAGRLREMEFEIPDTLGELAAIGEPLRAATISRSHAADELLPIPIDGSPFDPGRLLQYRRIYEADLQVRDSVRATCSALDAAFAAVPRNSLPLEAASEIVNGKFAWCVDPNLRNTHCAAVIAALNWTRLIGFDRGCRTISRRWALSSSYVVNSTFGYQLRVNGLNTLLDGGLLLPADHGLAVLVTGRPGVGKTTLMLQIAASLSADGFTSIYLAAEEQPNSLLDKLSYIGYERAHLENGPRMLLQRGATLDGRSEPPWQVCVVATDDIPDPDFINEPPPCGAKAGYLILATVPDRRNFAHDNSPQLAGIAEVLDRCASNGKRTALIVDSLEAVIQTATQKNHRRAIESLFNFSRNNATIALFAGERHDSDSPGFSEYLTDMHLHLGHSGTSPTRSISIVKSRHQSTIRGPQQYAIHGGSGFDCYPSPRARLSIMRRRIRPQTVPTALQWHLPELDFDALLKGDVANGDSVLLKGPSATHKFLIGLSFLSSGLDANHERDVLLISLRQDLTSVLRVMDVHSQFKQHMLDPECLPQPGLNQRVRFLHAPPDYFSGSRFFSWVRRAFLRSNRPISRVLVHTIDEIGASSPLVREEPLFVALLIEYFKAHGASSLFVLSEDGDTSLAPNPDLFDGVLLTSRAGKESEVTITVGHSAPCNAEQRAFHLEHTSIDGAGALKLFGPGTSSPDAPKKARNRPVELR